MFWLGLIIGLSVGFVAGEIGLLVALFMCYAIRYCENADFVDWSSREKGETK